MWEGCELDAYKIDDQISIFEKQNQLVVKSNELIRRSRYSLTMQEQKVILFLISRVKPDDTDFQEYEFDVAEFCRICGVDCSGGKTFKDLIKTLSGLHDKSFWIETEDDRIMCTWVQKAKIKKRTLRLSVRLDEDLKPYLLQIKKNFTSYELSMTLPMKSKHSIRLYELLKSYTYIGYKEYDIEKLKVLLDTAKYKEYKNFRVRVIDHALSEINKYTDLDVSYEPRRTGRSITSIVFFIHKKDNTAGSISALYARASRLNKGAVHHD